MLAHKSGRTVVDSTDMYSRTPLDNAARQNCAEIAELLLQAGADVNHKDMTGRTPLGVATDSNSLQVARVLINNGADVHVPYGGKGRRITVTDWGLIHAAAWGPYPEIAELLLREGVQHDLHSAAGLGDVAALLKLLDQGADLEAKRVDGRTALHWAAMNGQDSAVQLLLDRGAAIDAEDIADRTPLQQAASKDSTGNRVVARLLIDAGAKATLFDAAAAGHVEKLEALIKEGSNRKGDSEARRIDPSDGEAYTKDEFMELYDGSEDEWNAADPEPGTSHESDPATHDDVDSVVNSPNQKGETALMVAAKSNQVDTMRTLLRHGANVNAAESHGDTALMICADTPDSIDAAKMLIQHGGLGITGFCRRANHQRGRAAMAALVGEYFRRKETEAERQQLKRKEINRCLKTRADQSFVLDDKVRQHSIHMATQDHQKAVLASLVYCFFVMCACVCMVHGRVRRMETPSVRHSRRRDYYSMTRSNNIHAIVVITTIITLRREAQHQLLIRLLHGASSVEKITLAIA